MIFQRELVEFVKKVIGKEVSFETPPDPKLGDLAFPCFSFAKELRKAPAQIAQEFAGKLSEGAPSFVDRVEATGPYVNITFKTAELAKAVLGRIGSQEEKFGHGDKRDEKVMIEFSQPNPYKGMHIGHLRNTVLGEALVRVMRAAGFSVIPVNLYNDTGTHVAKCLWGWKRLNDFGDLEGDKGKKLGEIYAQANKLIKESEQYQQEVRELNKRLDEGDPALVKVWKKGRDWSVRSFEKIYEELDVRFEHITYDSDLVDEAKQIIDELVAKGVAIIDEGATIVDLKKYGLHVVLIRKSDGTLVYIAKDLALAKRRFTKFDIDRLIYVVGADQKTHFAQLFKMLELWGFEKAKDCYHLSYELVQLKEGKMSSREGNVILYEHLRDRVFDHARKGVKERHADWSVEEVDASARNIALGAMKFSMLSQDNNKILSFDWEKALEFEGETGPYLQYTHARIRSLLEKAGGAQSSDVDHSQFKEPCERELLKILARYPDVVQDAALQYRPSLLAHYLLGLARAFNEFYHAAPVLKADGALKDARLVLVRSVGQVLANALGLLAIPAPERM